MSGNKTRSGRRHRGALSPTSGLLSVRPSVLTQISADSSANRNGPRHTVSLRGFTVRRALSLNGQKPLPVKPHPNTSAAKPLSRKFASKHFRRFEGHRGTPRGTRDTGTRGTQSSREASPGAEGHQNRSAVLRMLIRCSGLRSFCGWRPRRLLRARQRWGLRIRRLLTRSSSFNNVMSLVRASRS